MTIDDLKDFRIKKYFAVRGGIPFAKKMWRDGYNKALEDVVNHFEVPASEISDEGHTVIGPDGQRSPTDEASDRKPSQTIQSVLSPSGESPEEVDKAR
jgi:hypothetical protein